MGSCLEFGADGSSTWKLHIAAVGPWTDWRSRQTKGAVSSDGINWTVTGFVDPDPDVETAHVPEAFMVDRDGHIWLYIFYGVQVGGDPYHFRYDRMRYMRRRLD